MCDHRLSKINYDILIVITLVDITLLSASLYEEMHHAPSVP